MNVNQKLCGGNARTDCVRIWAGTDRPIVSVEELRQLVGLEEMLKVFLTARHSRNTVKWFDEVL
jgi:hypothetical protein